MRKARRPAATALALALALQLGAAVPAAAADITATAGYENGNSSLNLTQIARTPPASSTWTAASWKSWPTPGQRFAYAINGQSGLLAAISLENLAAGSSVARLRGTDIDVKALVEAADSSFRYGDMTSVAISPDSATLAAALQRRGTTTPAGWPCSPVMPTAPSP